MFNIGLCMAGIDRKIGFVPQFTETFLFSFCTSGLDFTLQSLERSEANPTEELSMSFTKGYEGTLRQYHGMLVRPIFAVRVFRLIDLCRYIREGVYGRTVIVIF